MSGFLILKAKILTKCSEITPAEDRLLLHFTCHQRNEYTNSLPSVVTEVENTNYNIYFEMQTVCQF